MSGRGIVRRGSIRRGSVRLGKCPVWEVSVGDVSVGDVFVGEVSVGDVSGYQSYLVSSDFEVFLYILLFDPPAFLGAGLLSRLLSR